VVKRPLQAVSIAAVIIPLIAEQERIAFFDLF